MATNANEQLQGVSTLATQAAIVGQLELCACTISTYMHGHQASPDILTAGTGAGPDQPQQSHAEQKESHHNNPQPHLQSHVSDLYVI